MLRAHERETRSRSFGEREKKETISETYTLVG
jgi:hypothetical protein